MTDWRKCKNRNCDNEVETAATGRARLYCSDACRQAAYRSEPQRRLHTAGKRYETPPRHNLASGEIDPISTVESIEEFCHETNELGQGVGALRFEEWPPRQKRTDSCITYVLTDGKQVNTGYGRGFRSLGYVMEICPGRWVARVGDNCSTASPLSVAKQAAIDFHRYQQRGEPRDWIDHLNRIMAAEIDGPQLKLVVSNPPVNTTKEAAA